MKVISYNLRFASEEDAQPWSRRRGPMIDLLTELAPSVLGTQEGLDHQLQQVLAGLGERYAMVAEHRGDGGSEENSAIFYDTTQLEVTAVEHRWFSETPQVSGSVAWGSSFPRMYSLARLRRRADGGPLVVLSTHFDHVSELAQLRSAEQLRAVVASVEPGVPVVVMGDFNVGEDSEPYRVLTGSGLRDAYLVADQHGPRWGTFNDYGTPDPLGERIDWILVNDAVRVRSARIVTDSPGGQFPSDHLPVEAVLWLPTSP